MVRKIATEAITFQFHCKTNILHSVFTLKSRIQVRGSGMKLVFYSKTIV
ncbi:MAG: hypothetical protein OFPII_40820 [Osedax symbiont Rs1]|nr:MAG: hypothetical protein OFPII_40820 [Osedax symbiont Rs1]